MSRKILVATLGTSPAVVTEALDLLAEQQVEVNGVVLLVTQDPDVKQGADLLADHIPAYYKTTRIDSIIGVASYGDVDTSEAAVEFMQEACRVLLSYRNAGCQTYVSIAGGRKVMSALMVLAVQFYGATRLFHVWVPPWIEEEGDIYKLRSLLQWPEELTAKLHPGLDPPESDRPRLVELPFIGLFPLLPDILGALRGTGPRSRELKDMLVANGLLNSQGETTPLGKNVAEILQRVEGLPPARQEECRFHLPHHHYVDRWEKLARQLASHFPFIIEIKSIEWRSGEATRARSGNLIDVYKQVGTEAALGFQLVTTASTDGQLEAARRVVERWLVEH